MAEDEEADCPNNARLFRIAVSNSLKSIAESVRKAFARVHQAHQLTFEEFHEAFGETKASRHGDRENEFLEILTILKSNPSTAQKLHKAMIKELYRSMNDDLEDILKEGSLQETLTIIAKLSEESMTSVNEDAWRPPGDISSHLRSLDAHEIKKAIVELEKQVNEMERENETLMKTIAESRSRIRATNDNVMRILDCAPVILQQLEKKCEQLATCLKTIENE